MPVRVTSPSVARASPLSAHPPREEHEIPPPIKANPSPPDDPSLPEWPEGAAAFVCSLSNWKAAGKAGRKKQVLRAGAPAAVIRFGRLLPRMDLPSAPD